MKLLMLKGLPASGKSTYAKELVQSRGYTRVNKDDLRSMMHNGKWSKGNENQVLAIRDLIIGDALLRTRNVVVDDTNFAPFHEEKLKATAKLHGATFEMQFFDTPIEECIKRDLARPNSVGEKVIRDMYNQYLRPKPNPEPYNPELPNAIICDIDGTLAHMVNRGPHDTSKYMDDAKDDLVHSLFATLSSKHQATRIIVSGRSDEFRDVTAAWLEKHGITYDHLYMRDHTRVDESGNHVNDSIIKHEIYDQFIRGKFNVMCVIDDRNRVVDMWRNDLGLVCLQVAEGDF